MCRVWPASYILLARQYLRATEVPLWLSQASLRERLAALGESLSKEAGSMKVFDPEDILGSGVLEKVLSQKAALELAGQRATHIELGPCLLLYGIPVSINLDLPLGTVRVSTGEAR